MSLPTLYASDLRRQAGAIKLDIRSNGDDTWALRFTFAGGRTRDQTTARCRIVIEGGCGHRPKTGERCNCKPGQARDNCPACEGTGWRIDFAAIRARNKAP